MPDKLEGTIEATDAGALGRLDSVADALPSALGASEAAAQTGTGLQLWIVLALVVGLLALIFFGVRRLGRTQTRGARRVLLIAGAATSAVALSMGTWAWLLPEPQRGQFVLSHQVVRVLAAFSGTVAILVLLALAVPWTLDLLERSGFTGLIAARHLRAKKSGFLTLISLLSITAVTLSSLLLCVVVSVMGGFGSDIKRKILGNNAHISIDQRGGSNGLGGPAWDRLLDRVRVTPGVEAATPLVTGEAMASSRSYTAGVLIRGVDPESMGQVIDLVDNIEVGRFEYLSEPEKLRNLPADEPIWLGRGGNAYLKGPSTSSASEDPDEAGDSLPRPGLSRPPLDAAVAEVLRPSRVLPSVILGRELAKTLRVYVGDELTLISPVGDLGPMGVMPRARRFLVGAVFFSGMYEYDSSHAYLTLEAAQDFLDRPGQISQIDVKVAREGEAQAVGARLQAALSAAPPTGVEPPRVRDWQKTNRGLFSALKLEKIVTFITLSIAIVVGSFCIICTLLLMVTEKRKDIAVLKATGASNSGILRVFMSEGLLIGGIGTIFGVVWGLVLCGALLWFGVRLPPEVYYVDRLPIHIDPLEYAIVALAAMAITCAATLYPALAASRLRPVEGIRYE